MMRNRTLYIFFIAITALFSLQSCSLEEVDAPVSGGAGHTYIEFIARATSYNKTDVATKSAVSDIESAVYNAFLLVFDDAGTRIMCKEITDPTVTPSASIPIDKGLSSVTACFLINVPSSFANGIKGLTKPTNDANALDNEYINTAVLSGISYGTGANFGLPYIDLDGPAEGSRPAVACIPMFGMEEVNLNSNSARAQITVKRLFAKITVDLKLDMDLSDWNNLVQTYTYLQLNYYELKNVPNRVRLIESTDQSAWVTNPNSDAFITTAISSGPINKQIYNQDSNTSNNKTCVFEFYAPEYYLNRATNWTDDEKSKPNNKPANAKAIYLFLDATYSQYSLTTTDLQYEIYLGRDAISDFSLARNVNYINSLTVVGVDESNLDHRVTTTVINNPVAKEGKAANCYIIAQPGKYTIPAYKGAYNDLTEATLCFADKNLSEYETRVEVLANVVEYESITSISFSELPAYDSQTNTISFTVNSMLSNNWVPNGSVIMALQYRKKGATTWTTEWSWHLWFVYSITASDDGWGTIGYQSMPDGANDMMDRNLGVHAFTSADTKAGFYYKYGEHTPYLDPDGDGTFAKYGGGILYDSNSQPVTPTWSASKSPTDPCPPGYKVPSSSVWYNSKQTNMSISNTSFTYRPSISSQDISFDPIYYPISGHVYMDADNNYQSDNSRIIKNQDSYIDLPIELVKRGNKGQKNSYRFIKIVTNEKIIDQFGLSLGADKAENLYYANRQTEKTSKGIQYNLGTAKGYTALTGIDWDNTVLTMTTDEFKSNFYAQYIALEAYKDILQGLENTFTSELIYTNTGSIDERYCYQVRCVSEVSPVQ